MPFLQINTIPHPSHSTQPPPAHAHTFCMRLYEHAYLLSTTSRLSCHNYPPSSPSCLYSEVRMSTLIAGTTPPFGYTSRRSSIRSTTTSTSFFQLPTTAAPSSFTQLPLLLEVRMSTPYCWHHSLARVRLRRSSIRSTTLHVSCSDHSFKTCS